ncbi:MAG: arylsulfatase A, partial [Planctomycetota bacterium]
RSGDSHLLQRTPNKCNDISELTTLPEALKLVDASYRTAHFGKWHLHSGGPSRNGFDVSDGPTINTEGDVSDPDPKLTFSISESGIGFMRECAEQERPFFLQLSYYAVHLELHALDATLAKYEALPGGDKHANPLYAAMTEDLDTGVGRVLDAIDKLDLQDNTYVIYASDNGAYVNLNQVRVQGEISSCEPLRNGKFWLYEGGLRVPMIVSGPGIARGAYSRNVVSQTDLYPTFVELAGGKPADTLDGVSIRRLFADPDGPKIERRDDALFFHYPHYNRQATPHSSIVDGDMKLIKFWEDGALQMFDLSVDLEESVNLAEAQSELAASMEARLQRYLEQVDALLPKRK